VIADADHPDHAVGYSVQLHPRAALDHIFAVHMLAGDLRPGGDYVVNLVHGVPDHVPVQVPFHNQHLLLF